VDSGVRWPKARIFRQELQMMVMGRRALGWLVVGAALAVGPAPAAGVEVGQAAPDFKLAGTLGGDVSLADFRGKKWVLLEFYGADFSPT
jgi:hypothetical protein